jgi:hypothetical protein
MKDTAEEHTALRRTRSTVHRREFKHSVIVPMFVLFVFFFTSVYSLAIGPGVYSGTYEGTWLMCYARNRKVAGLIRDEVNF